METRTLDHHQTGSRGKRAITPAALITMFARIREAVADHPKAALFELRDLGFSSVFEQLCACVISMRTLDEVTLNVSRKLFEHARDARGLLRLSEDELIKIIRPSTFARQKAPRMRQIARIAVERFQGELPCDFHELMALPGIGPKCANLVLAIACEVPMIGVDVHVHRVTNRWGYVATKSPEKTLQALEAKLPKPHWIEINELLVPFGKHICTRLSPKCGICPVLEYCQQIGVSDRVPASTRTVEQ